MHRTRRRGHLLLLMLLASLSLASAAEATERVQADDPQPRSRAFRSSSDQWAIERWRPQTWWSIPAQPVVVAVVDSGTSVDAPWLAEQLWSNPDEVANGIDDDANGFVDDLHGVDLVDGDVDPTPTDPHGSHVASIIAADHDGMVLGMAPNARIMVVRAFRVPEGGDTGRLAAGIRYAAREGAQVINVSGGAPMTSSVAEAVAEARSLGAIVVAAAGNQGMETATSPASEPGVIAVGAYDRAGQRAAFSNFGADVDVYAPGAEILGHGLDGDLLLMSGTSQASPHIAALYALMLGWSPGSTEQQLTAEIQALTVDRTLLRLDGLRGRTSRPALPQMRSARAVLRLTASSAREVRYRVTGAYRVRMRVAGSTLRGQGTSVLLRAPRGPHTRTVQIIAYDASDRVMTRWTRKIRPLRTR